MLSKEQLDFLLRITDYFHGHWEDPEWGKRYLNQILVLVSAHTLVSGLEDAAVRRQVMEPIEKAVAEIAERAVKASK
jgi:hypothetical protein